MKRLLLCLAVLLFGAGQVRAAVLLDYVARGWYEETGGKNGGNYFAGQDYPGTTGKVYRNYFVFDLSSIKGAIVSAALVLNSADYLSPDATEEYILRHVSTPVDDLGRVSSVSIFNDLADGSIYGSRIYSNLDDRVVYTIALNALAIAGLNTSTGGKFALGGHVSSLSGQRATAEGLFADSQSDAISRLWLEFQPVPEPPILAIWSLLGCIGLAIGHGRRRRKAGGLT